MPRLRRSFHLFILLILTATLLAIPGRLWAPLCSGCRATLEEIKKCSERINSKDFSVRGRDDSETAMRVENALKNKMLEILETAGMPNAGDTHTASEFKELREDFHVMNQYVLKQAEEGRLHLDKDSEDILEECSEALH